MTAVQILKNGTVIDRRALAKLSDDDMNSQMAAAYAAGNVMVINDADKFSSNHAVMSALAANSIDLPLILEMRGIVLTDDEKFIVGKNVELTARIESILNAVPETPAVAYVFAKLPAKWVLEDKIHINKAFVQRNSSSYRLGIKTLQKIWDVAGPYWAKQKGAKSVVYIQAMGRPRSAAINSKIVKIGCQQVNRYELEQVALKMGWAFP